MAVGLDCEHVVVHAPSLLAEQIKSTRPDADLARLDGLVRHLLWPMVRNRAERRMLNRVRLRQGAPILPLRLLLWPLFGKSGPIGLVAAIREGDRPPFQTPDLDLMASEIPALQARLDGRIDATTGMLSRADFEEELALRSRPRSATCVVYGNLDRIHALNEFHGFRMGDEVIERVGRLWQRRLHGRRGIAAHLSGDRFVAVLFNRTLKRTHDWALSTREEIERLRFSADGQTRVTASLGIAPINDGESFHRALAAAETACRIAKERGRNRVEVYEVADGTVVRRHAEVRTSRAIIHALESNNYVLHAQEIVSLSRSGAAGHFEILLRIREPDGNLASVAPYLEAAEHYQLLEQLDRWVVRNALEELAPHAPRLHQRQVSFAINITGQSLSEPTFADFVGREVQRNGLPAGFVDFEFTETAAVRNLKATRRFIECIARIGSRMALDDFGTGLSSLGLLKDLDVQRIKIDGRFIRDVLHNPCSQALVKGMIDIARRLDLETVAEFVETQEVADHLRALGVHYAQGHLFGHARPLAETLESLRETPVPLAMTANG